MNANVFSVGSKVELELTDDIDPEIKKTYTGEFFEILNDMEVVILLDGMEPTPFDFSKDIKVKAFYLHQLYGMIKFEGVVKKREKIYYGVKPGTKLYIRINEDFKEVQNRVYFRPVSFLKAEYRRKAKRKDGTEIPYKKAKTRNISYKGVCLVLEEPGRIKKDDFIDLVIWFKPNQSIRVDCRVLRISEFEMNEKLYYEIGMSIESIDDEDKDKLTEYITKSVIMDSIYLEDPPLDKERW